MTIISSSNQKTGISLKFPLEFEIRDIAPSQNALSRQRDVELEIGGVTANPGRLATESSDFLRTRPDHS